MSRLEELVQKQRAGTLEDAERVEALELARSNALARERLEAAGFFVVEEGDEPKPDAASGAPTDSAGDAPHETPSENQPQKPRASLPARIFFLIAAGVILGTVALAPLLGIESSLADLDEGELYHNGRSVRFVREPMLVSIPAGVTTKLDLRGGSRLQTTGPATLDIRERGAYAQVRIIAGEVSIGRPTGENPIYVIAGPFLVEPGEGASVEFKVQRPHLPGAAHSGIASLKLVNRNANLRYRSMDDGLIAEGVALDTLPRPDQDWLVIKEGSAYECSLRLPGTAPEERAAETDAPDAAEPANGAGE